ncbi:MAG: outer rane biosis protein, partial [Armatimonadetes bacterium]|nr:outer rane biosis protein [Armatimonadota bacterium]
KITLKGAEKVWDQPHVSGVCGPIVHDGKVYWAWEGLHCVDWDTGELVWEGGRFGIPASLAVTGDDRVIVWANEGDLALVEGAKRSPTEFKQLAIKSGLGKTEAWPHLAVADGRVYVKDRSGNLTCLALPGGEAGK